MDAASETVPGAEIALPTTGSTIELPEAEAARTALEAHYADDLPRLVSMWLMSKKSAHTRRSYARGFRRWEAFCRSVDVHPMEARRPHADAWMRSLEQAGSPATTVAHALSTASSFYKYAVSVDATDRNPLLHVDRPTVDPDHSDTEGLTEDEMARLIAAARANSPRAYAVVVLLYTLGLRVDGALAADVASLGYDRGHRTLTITKKGGATAKLPLPPITVDALETYLDGRADGPLFLTRSGARLREPEVWKLLRRLARRASLPQADSIHPHVLRHGFITDALDQGVPLHVVQDAAGHKDPRTTQRYNRARKRLDGHPAYKVAAAMAERLEHSEESQDAVVVSGES
ncbi:tyrosine-type recombinase/integrase [Streptomyces antibioticus]|uniref:tyrosine-type recombinase/integrase n=1 Tax=Streptomyces antibioticus TaxID=1890 RepID=UPI003721D4C1